MDERSKMLIEASPIMKEIHEKAQDPNCECLHVTKIAERTGLRYVDGGKVLPCGGKLVDNVKPWGIKDCLIKWRWIDDDIDMVRKELRMLKTRFSDPAITDYEERMRAKGQALPKGLEELLIERERLEGIYMEELAFLLDVRRRIQEFLAVVDEVDRKILTLRYLEGKQWEVVADIMDRVDTKLCFDHNKMLERWDNDKTYVARRRYTKRKSK